MCIVVDAEASNEFAGKKSCALETVTLAPIATNLIALHMLTKEEIAWVDTYHKRVRETLLPVVTINFPEAVQYLLDRTQPLNVVLK